MRRSPALALLLAAITVSGCGGSTGGTHAPNTGTGAAAATTTSTEAASALVSAARRAVVAHHRLSVRVLWTNQVPKQPQWIADSALRALQVAARDRRERGVQVRLVQEDFRIVSLKLDPSYATATAVVIDRQTGVMYENGQRMRRQVHLNERARVQLRRVGGATRFVVSKVVLLS